MAHLEQALSASPKPRMIRSRTIQVRPAAGERERGKDSCAGAHKELGINLHMTRLVTPIIPDAAANP